jgi:drug/metabolite transporter (DMT)-like permease
MNAYFAMGWQMFFSAIIVAVLSFSTEKVISLTTVSLHTWLVIAYLIFAGSMIAIVAFVYSMKHLNPAIAVLYAYINPIVAMVTGTILLNEKITTTILVGSLITLLGVYLVNYSMRKIREKEMIGE